MIIHKTTDSPQMQLEWARRALAEAKERLEEKMRNPNDKASLLMIQTDVKRAEQEIACLEPQVGKPFPN